MHRLLVGAVVPLGSNVGSPLFVFSMPGVLRFEPLSISIIIRLGLKGRLWFECIRNHRVKFIIDLCPPVSIAWKRILM